MEKISAKLQLSKQRTQEACELAELNQLGADAAEQESGLCSKEIIGISQSPIYNTREIQMVQRYPIIKKTSTKGLACEVTRCRS